MFLGEMEAGSSVFALAWPRQTAYRFVQLLHQCRNQENRASKLADHDDR